MDANDNELLALETVHLFVELLESYFSNVCELDIVFNFNKVGNYRVICIPCLIRRQYRPPLIEKQTHLFRLGVLYGWMQPVICIFLNV